jgi:GNAT superfamily N-acetyltransferase
MSDAVLRAATRADAPALADLARRSFAATYVPTHDAGRIRIHCETVLSDPAVAAWFDVPDARIAVAVGQSALLGYVQWQPADAPIPAWRPVELKRLYVDPAALGGGLGQRLFDHVRDDARAQGADLLWLCVYAGNARARRFYARQGLVEIGRVPYRFVDQVEDDLALGLRFTPAPP